MVIIIINSRVVVVSFFIFIVCFTPVDILNLIFRFDKVCSIWPKGCCIVVV